jgi:hypothetical protein
MATTSRSDARSGMPGSKMLGEIREEPAALSRTLDACTKTAEELPRRFEKQRPRLVVIVARGSFDADSLRREDRLPGCSGGRDLAVR